jgi:hypothetical protein
MGTGHAALLDTGTARQPSHIRICEPASKFTLEGISPSGCRNTHVQHGLKQWCRCSVTLSAENPQKAVVTRNACSRDLLQRGAKQLRSNPITGNATDV